MECVFSCYSIYFPCSPSADQIKVRRGRTGRTGQNQFMMASRFCQRNIDLVFFSLVGSNSCQINLPSTSVCEDGRREVVFANKIDQSSIFFSLVGSNSCHINLSSTPVCEDDRGERKFRQI